MLLFLLLVVIAFFAALVFSTSFRGWLHSIFATRAPGVDKTLTEVEQEIDSARSKL